MVVDFFCPWLLKYILTCLGKFVVWNCEVVDTKFGIIEYFQLTRLYIKWLNFLPQGLILPISVSFWSKKAKNADLFHFFAILVLWAGQIACDLITFFKYLKFLHNWKHCSFHQARNRKFLNADNFWSEHNQVHVGIEIQKH